MPKEAAAQSELINKMAGPAILVSRPAGVLQMAAMIRKRPEGQR